MPPALAERLHGRRFGKIFVAMQAAQADQGVAVGWHRLVSRLKAGVSIEDRAEEIARRGLLTSLNVHPQMLFPCYDWPAKALSRPRQYGRGRTPLCPGVGSWRPARARPPERWVCRLFC
ncbi:hypothetical protein FFR93_20900 [Rhizobium sp. MHM7A]|nr:hypothetical protein FFR93_20900 [Rhizobium sp. MHM7A]